jgi:ATP-dependent protease ClpP protease subunit
MCKKLEGEKYGEYTLSGEINQERCTALADTMIAQALDWKGEGKQGTFRLTIYTLGGSCDAGFHLGASLLRIRNMGFPVETCVSGGAYSMGFIVAQFGTHRFMEATAKAHIHTVQSSYVKQPEAYLEDDVAGTQQTKNTVAQVFASRNTAGYDSPQFWKDTYLNGRDYYFTAERALELGLIDEIIGGFDTLRPAPQAAPDTLTTE